MRCDFSQSVSKVKCCNYVFRYFRQNGTFFREMAFAAMFLDSFVFFVVKRLSEIPNSFVFYHWNHYLFVRTIPIGKD